jgi:hypothetical protein
MGKTLTNWVVDSILSEDIKKEVVVYSGRFQPFHSGHAKVYEHLVSKFGKNNVFIGTSNKQGGPRHPFNFREKREVMTTMFKIPSNKIVQVKNPYSPSEVMDKFPEKTTAFITVVGKKDANRLASPGYQKYFSMYKKGNVDTGYKDKGYVYVSPSFGNISGTDVRKGMSRGSDSQRKSFFKKVYGKFNPKIFNLVSGRLISVESVMESFLQSININSLINEASQIPTSGKGIVDDGPGAFYGNMKSYKAEMEEVVGDLGWDIVNYLMDEDSMESFNTHYPNGPGRYQVSFFPSGDTMDGQKKRYGKDITGRPAYRKWAKHIKRVALRLGMEFVKFAEPKDLDNLTPKTLTKKQQGKSASLKEDLKRFEAIVGDSIECDECDHSWKIEDGGDDLYICHECGNDNEPTIDEKKKPKSKKASLMKQKRNFYLKPDNAKKELDNSGKEGQVLSKKVGKQRLYFVSYVGNAGTQNIFNESMIMEGGAYGHMNHPFDTEINLTFGDLKIIISKALEGTLEFAREKTDGQALAISYRKDRGIIAARNKGHLKDRGLNALDIKGVADKFANRGGLTDAYNFAMRDLESAISKLSDAQRSKIFKDGSKFMNLEVIWPESVNVIPYGQPLLVFHGTMEYNEDGKAIGADTSDAKVLAGMIKQVNADVQDNYTIQGPPVVKIPRSQDLSNKKSIYSSKVSKLQKEFKLKDSNGVADYHQAWWSDFVDKNSPTTLDNKTKMGLVKRWAFYDKSFRLDKKNISDSKTRDWANKTDKIDHSKMAKNNMKPFEDIFLGLGAEVLSFMSSALTVNPDKSLRDIQKQLDKVIKDVQKSGDPKKIAKLKMELERLKSIGGRDKIVPNEGIVFLYKGGTYKLTGTFAPLNQILGLFY